MPQYGMPYQRLPGTQTNLTPESALQWEIQTGRKQIWDRFTLQWNEIGRSERFIGKRKMLNMRRELHIKAKQETLQFDQKARQQLAQLQNIDRLAQQELISPEDAARINASRVFGADAARSMYPKPEREKSIPQQFGELDIYSHRISDELKWFKEDKPPRVKLKGLGFVSPLAGAVAVYRGLREPKRKVRVWDPATEDYTKKATPEEIAEYDMWLQEKRDVAKYKRELTGQLDISRRITQPGVTRSGFDAGIAESIKPQRQPTITKPKVIRQQSKLTGQIRESRDGGKTWQIVSG
jgi:hypothetical protein